MAVIYVYEKKYGKMYVEHDTLPDGSPVFLFLPTDPLTPLALDDYARRCEELGCTVAYIISIRDRAHEVRQWQIDNPKLVKERPD